MTRLRCRANPHPLRGMLGGLAGRAAVLPLAAPLARAGEYLPANPPPPLNRWGRLATGRRPQAVARRPFIVALIGGAHRGRASRAQCSHGLRPCHCSPQRSVLGSQTAADMRGGGMGGVRLAWLPSVALAGLTGATWATSLRLSSPRAGAGSALMAAWLLRPCPPGALGAAGLPGYRGYRKMVARPLPASARRADRLCRPMDAHALSGHPGACPA